MILRNKILFLLSINVNTCAEKSGGSRIRKKTPFKVAPKSEEARRIMKDKLRYEYDFYYFVRSRFARICDTLGIQHNVNITHAP